MQIYVIGRGKRLMMEQERDRDPATRAWSHLLGAHALALRAIEARLTAAGLPPLAWYDVLLELARAGGKLRVGELGEHLVVEPHNVTRLLDRLEAQGLLKRQRAREDRRGVCAVLTEKGATLRGQMWPPYRSAIREVFGAALSAPDAEALTVLLKKVIAQLRRAGDAASRS